MKVDSIAYFLITLHSTLGHRTAAHYLGQPVQEGEQTDCILCQYERGQATKAEVVERIGTTT
jgi:hypothetical protein